MSARKFPTGLPLVDSLRSCMLQTVPHGQMPVRCSGLPYDAAELISDLVDALEAVELARNTDEPSDWERATKLSDATLAKARGDL